MQQDSRHAIRVPELGVAPDQVRLSLWLVAKGSRLTAGDRVVEILTGDAVVDLPVAVSGVLAEKCVREDSRVSVGQVLGWIAADS